MKLNQKHTIKKHEYRKVASIKRHRYHHIIHKIHYKHRLSYRTLFYMKEYGPKSHVTSVIINESAKMLLLASLLSALGGVHIRAIQAELTTIVPLLILLPALTGMIGSFGAIVSSKFTTLLYLGKVPERWWHSEQFHSLIFMIFAIAIISAFYIASLAYIISAVKGFEFTYVIFLKVLAVSIVATTTLVGIIIMISIAGGLWIFKKHEDPNNFLIPISTSVADLGSLLLFSVLVAVFF